MPSSCPAYLPTVILRRGVPSRILIFFSRKTEAYAASYCIAASCAGKDVVSPTPPVAQPYTRSVWLLDPGCHPSARQNKIWAAAWRSLSIHCCEGLSKAPQAWCCLTTQCVAAQTGGPSCSIAYVIRVPPTKQPITPAELLPQAPAEPPPPAGVMALRAGYCYTRSHSPPQPGPGEMTGQTRRCIRSPARPMTALTTGKCRNGGRGGEARRA